MILDNPPKAPFNTPIQLYSWTDQLVQYRYGKLRMLILRLRLSDKWQAGHDKAAWSTARLLLNCPSRTPRAQILAHLEESLQSIEAQIDDLQSELAG